MSPLFGHTRSVLSSRYALLTPDGLVRAPLPGWPGAECIVVIGPPMGARFAQILVTLGPDASGAGRRPDEELFLFVRSGAVEVEIDGSGARLEPGGFAYITPGLPYSVRPAAPPAELLIFQKRFTPLPDSAPPAPVFGQEQDVAGAPFMGDEAALLKTLLPDDPAFDMAVNIFTFQPGATLPIVETHIMEHGMMMVQGQGIYRLAGDYHPVQTGDSIWMGPYCPQWFVATGKQPARYIYYKDVNRDPLV